MKSKINTAPRNEQIVDIIEKMPTQFSKWIAISIILFTFITLTLGWLIKYPDVITGSITINSTQAPVKLIAGSAGKIQLTHFKARDYIKENDYIAIIQNAANTNDVIKVKEILADFNPNQKFYSAIIDSLPEKVSLGELNLKYYTFLTALKSINHYNQENIYKKQKKNLEDYIKWQKILINQTIRDTLTSQEKILLIRKWLKRKQELFQKDMITEKEYDDLQKEYLNTQTENQQLQKNITNLHIQIAEAEGKLDLLKTEQSEQEEQMHLALLSSYNDLIDNIKAWEQKYVFKSPFKGQVEFLKFLTNNQYIQAGEEVFSIIPQSSTIIGQMLLPANGAGKVSPGSRVIIKLDNYPYMEYGSIEGKVNSISLLTKEQQIENNHIDTYLIHIKLPHELTTNYNRKLDFKYEIKGSADIIVNDRRLIERLFDNLKYRIQ